MQKFIKVNSFLLVLGVLFLSCDVANTPSNEITTGDRPNSVPGNIQANSSQTFNLVNIDENDKITNGAQVNVNRTYDVDEKETTFTYTVKNIVSTGKNRTLTDFTLNLPSCTPALILDRFGSNEGEGVIDGNVLQWDTTVPNPAANNTREYTITYEGDVPLGLINAEITRQGQQQTFSGSVAGPTCDSALVTVKISGTLFIDEFEINGELEDEEAGIKNVLVTLESEDGSYSINTTTTEWGDYSFWVTISSGKYTIIVPEELVDFKYYKIYPYTEVVSGPRKKRNTYEITVGGSNIESINFGYVLDTEELTQDLLSGAIEKNTKSAQYWAFQVEHAVRNRNLLGRNPLIEFTQDRLIAILKDIEDFYLDVPFQFGENKLQAALNILKGPIVNDYDELLRELLAAQLNVLSERRGAIVEYDESGKPIFNDPFNRAILIYGEQVACLALIEAGEAGPGCKSITSKLNFVQISGVTASGDLSFSLSGTSTLSAFNGTGGIGSR